MTPEELADAWSAFAEDMRTTMERYIDRKPSEIDLEQLEAEIRIIIALHFPSDARFQGVLRAQMTVGPEIEMIVTHDGVVVLNPYE